MTCLTPGTRWRFNAYAHDSGNCTVREVCFKMRVFPPDGKGGKPYSYPDWYNHDWYKKITAAQADELRDAVHNAVEPIVARWQGNPAAQSEPRAQGVGDDALREALREIRDTTCGCAGMSGTAIEAFYRAIAERALAASPAPPATTAGEG